MKRDINKAIADYQRKFEGNAHQGGAFYVEDLRQILGTAEGESGADRDYTLISNALQAGFMIGYRKGQADAKKGRANNG